VTKTDNTAY